MNLKEATEYAKKLTPEKMGEILHEHYHLKQNLCAKVLGTPTGAEDWLENSIERAMNLRESDHQLRKVIREGKAMLEEAQWRTKQTVCFNCRGRKRVGEEACCVCGGTGASGF